MSAVDGDETLLNLLWLLARRQYSFTTPSPLTHSRVVARANRQVAHTLTDIFGWSLPFTDTVADNELL